MADAVEVEEGGETLAVTFDDMMRYHGVHSPGGVAIAFKAMQRAFTALSPDGPPPATGSRGAHRFSWPRRA